MIDKIRYSLLILIVCAACGGTTTTPLTPAPPTSQPHVAGQVLVMLDDPEDGDEIDEVLDDFEGLELTRIGQTPFFVLRVPPGTDLDELLEELDDDLRIVDSTLDFVGESPEGGPSDGPILGSDLFSAIPAQSSLDALGITLAQGAGTGAGQLIAVLDTGIDFGHPFLAGSIAAGGFDFIDLDGVPEDEHKFLDEDADGVIDEQFGHGTFVASLVLTVAPDAMILPVRVLDAEGYGTASSVAAGIIWAVDSGATVINLSLDIPEDAEVIKDAVDYAKDNGVVIVAAAGNAGGEVVFPARYGDVVAVAAVDGAGVAAPFTNLGSRIDVVAPGVAVLGAMPQSVNPSGTARWSGTSFAAPLVAGTIALVGSARPQLEMKAVGERVVERASSVDAVNPGLQGRLGHGMVDAAAAAGP